MGRLQGQKALVTGGTRGIGKAIAELFVQEGAEVTIFGTNEEVGKQTAQEIGVHFMKVNVADTKLVKEAVETLGTLDILVNNAGITKDKLLLKMAEEDWDDVMAVNAKSLFNTCQAAIYPMLKARKGKIINMSSVVGLTGNAGQVNYASSKAAVIGFTKALAKEVAARNICVNCIAPGYTETAMTAAMTDKARANAIEDIPLGRIGLPRDIAEATLFLAGAGADYITGQVLTVDGGLTL